MPNDSLYKFISQQSRGIYLSVLILSLAGIIALFALPSGIYPEVVFPRVVVIVEAGDVAAKTLLPSVTRPIEESVSKIPGFKQVRTKTLRGAVEVSVEFSTQTDMKQALQEVRSRVGELKANFPNNPTITIERLMPSVFPVLSYNLTASNLSITDLNDLAIYQIRPRLLKVPGVAQVKIESSKTREIAIEVSPEKLALYRLTLNQIIAAIQSTNQVTVVGRSNNFHQQTLILGTGELFQPDDFKKIVVAINGGVPVTLQDVANIHLGSNDVVNAFNGNGRPAVLISILKQADGNLINISKDVNNELPKILKQVPLGVQIQPVYNLADLVSSSIDNLRDAILIGILLIIIIIFLFLRDWSTTLIAASTIPITMAITFAFMFIGQQTLNLMSLGGLAIAVGLVIDDGIVIIEGISHNLQLGLKPPAAIKKAITELTMPIISSTLTTIVVFAPLGLLEGVVGQFFTALSFTLSSSVIVSLFIALTLTPTMCRDFLRIKKKEGVSHKPFATKIRNFDLIKLLQKLLATPRIVITASIAVLVLLFPLSQMLEKEFMPVIDEGSFVLDYFAPAGTSLEDTDKIARKIETILTNIPEVMNFSRRTGAQMGLAATETSRGDILVRLVPLNKRRHSTMQVMQIVRKKLDQELPGIDMELMQILQDFIGDMADSPAPIAVKIFGDDSETLKNLSIQVGNILKSVNGVVDIHRNTRPSATEDTVQVNPVLASKFGLSVSDVLNQIKTTMLGTIVTSVREQEKLIPVRVRVSDSARLYFSEHLESLPISNIIGDTLPLAALATVELKSGNLEIRRENMSRLGFVTARLENRGLASAMKEIQAKIAKLKLPRSYYISYGGQWATQQAAFVNLFLVLGLAVLLVYLILVFQFRSLLTPIPILIAIPLSLFGVVIGLLVTHTALNISSFMGIILLVGLVVKNGIILLTYSQQAIKEGLTLDVALIEAVRLRLRPILMTTICTLLGLLPLALGIGAGSELQKPLAIAVISGLSFSTLVTLLVTPSLLLLIDKLVPKTT